MSGNVWVDSEMKEAFDSCYKQIEETTKTENLLAEIKRDIKYKGASVNLIGSIAGVELKLITFKAFLNNNLKIILKAEMLKREIIATKEAIKNKEI